jgi:hypothetical protein
MAKKKTFSGAGRAGEENVFRALELLERGFLFVVE